MSKTNSSFGLKTEAIDQIHNVFQRYPEVQKVVIYGSRAKGNFKPGSDIDLCLQGSDLHLSLFSKISEELDDLFLPYTFDLSIFHEVSNPDFLDHIKRVGAIFYP